MKIVVFSNSSWSVPLIAELVKSGHLAGLVIPNRLGEENDRIEQFVLEHDIPVLKVPKEGLEDELPAWLKTIDADVGICLTFPYLIPEAVIDIPRLGILNVHFGALPAYRGPEPLFWQLKEGKTTATICIHKMTGQFDQGPILHEERVAMLPGENYGLLGARLGVVAGQIMEELVTKLNSGQASLRDQPGPDAVWRKKPTAEDLTIRWDTYTADQIESLVNAANPAYGGAITWFRNSMIRILEVSPADVNNAALLGPGNIVYADAQNGIFVLCSDHKFLRINMVKTPEAYLTGNKLAALGVRQGEKFTLQPMQTEHA